MNSISDTIFVDNLHVMFGEKYLLNSVNSVFNDMGSEYKVAMHQRIYFEADPTLDIDSSPNKQKQKEILLDYLTNLLGEYFDKVKQNITRGGGGINKLDEVKNYIRQKVSNITPKFYK